MFLVHKLTDLANLHCSLSSKIRRLQVLSSMVSLLLLPHSFCLVFFFLEFLDLFILVKMRYNRSYNKCQCKEMLKVEELVSISRVIKSSGR